MHTYTSDEQSIELKKIFFYNIRRLTSYRCI